MRPIEAYWLCKQAAFADTAKQHAETAGAYLDAHKGEMARNSLNNVAYGLMSNPRGIGGTSLIGGSAGGIVDGILIRPVADAATSLVQRAARKFYGLNE